MMKNILAVERRIIQMTDKCQKPKNKKGEGKCTPEQIEKCHGKNNEHPCEEDCD